MSNQINVGDVIGSLTIIGKTEKRSHGYVGWLCKCKCNNTETKYSNYLNDRNTTKQCNRCSTKQQAIKISKYGSISVYKRLLNIGRNARNRCERKSNTSYKYYGERGIRFKFKSIKHFAEWSLSHGYNDNLTIERIDVNGNYSPENCCWIPMKMQAKNKTTTPHFMGYNGYKEIASFIGITVKSLQAMIYKKHMSFDEIYNKSKNDPDFYKPLYEKTSSLAMKRKEEWKLSKETVEEIIKRISNGEKRTPLSKEYNVDFNTLVKAISRYEKGYYI